MVRAYGMYKAGFLPNGNGWNNETNKYMDAMSVIDNALQKRNRAELKKKTKKAHTKHGRR